MEQFYLFFFYFFIYSVIGWCAEMIYCGVINKKIIPRGFLYGPYCPIYGFGGLIVTYILAPLAYNPIYIFFGAMILTSILEYITSFLLEKIFNAKWWDYSTYKFNLNGRICLLNSLEFAILGLLVTYILHPKIVNFVSTIPEYLLHPISLILLSGMVIDFCFTLNSILDLKQKLKVLDSLHKSLQSKAKTDIELSKDFNELKDNIIGKATSMKLRLLEAFPNLEFKTLDEVLKDLKEDIAKKKAKMKELKTKK